MSEHIRHNNEHLAKEKCVHSLFVSGPSKNYRGTKIGFRLIDNQIMGEAKELDNRLLNYFDNGGLFNPEMMEHEKVRDLLLDLHAFVRKIKGE